LNAWDGAVHEANLTIRALRPLGQWEVRFALENGFHPVGLSRKASLMHRSTETSFDHLVGERLQG
jgi:hypothetical protein